MHMLLLPGRWRSRLPPGTAQPLNAFKQVGVRRQPASHPAPAAKHRDPDAAASAAWGRPAAINELF
jgi:hypothetical protein